MDVRDVVSDKPVVHTIRQAASLDGRWRPFLDKLIEVVTYLEIVSPASRIDALLSPSPPTLLLMIGGKCSVKLSADSVDSPRRTTDPAGLHYRMQFHREKNKPTRDVRTVDLAEVARQIRRTFNLREN